MSTDISVVICTFNRAQMLHDTLESWLQVEQGDIAAELLVVDNASTDRTPRVVEEFRTRCPGTTVRYVAESRAGLSFARNRGIAEAAGEIIAFVDDDIYFEPQWLRSVCRGFAENPQAHCIGGKSIPLFEVEEPDWLSDKVMKFYGSTESGDENRPMRFPEHPFGVNMAFRREVFEHVEGFRTDLGRKGYSLLSNEEKEFFYRVDRAGLEVLYVADAVLYHRVPGDRVDPAWLRRRAYWQGISNVVFDKHIGRHSRGRLLRSLLRSSRALLLGSGQRTLRSVYDYYRRPDMPARLFRYTMLGVVRQSLVELVRPPAAEPSCDTR